MPCARYAFACFATNAGRPGQRRTFSNNDHCGGCMTKTSNKRWSLGRRVVLLQFAVAIAASPVSGQEEDTPPPGMPADFVAAFYGPQKPDPVKYPWVVPKLSPDRRAE